MSKPEGITFGVRVVPCEECEHRYAMDIVRSFRWPSTGPDSVMGFDRKTNEILVNEHALMRLIQILNPAQQPRPIRLVSQDEFFGKKG